MKDPRTIYAEIGEDTFHQLTRAFYGGIAQDPLVRPLYPEADLEPSRRRLALFLIQYFGGPRTYSEERGHPQLRGRHMPFTITPSHRDAWMGHMRSALASLDLAEDTRQAMERYFEDASTFLVNSRIQL